MGDKLITIFGEENILVSHIPSFRYIEANGETLETLFQALEVDVVSLKNDIKRPRTSMSSWKKLKVMIEGVNPEGWDNFLDLPEKIDLFGLGYQQSSEETSAPKANQRQICTIQKVFYNTGFNHDGKIAMIEEVDENMPNLVYQCSLDDTFNN